MRSHNLSQEALKWHLIIIPILISNPYGINCMNSMHPWFGNRSLYTKCVQLFILSLSQENTFSIDFEWEVYCQYLLDLEKSVYKYFLFTYTWKGNNKTKTHMSIKVYKNVYYIYKDINNKLYNKTLKAC